MKASPVDKSAPDAVLLKSGPEFFGVLMDLIDKAESEIHLQTYILEDDVTGRKVINAIKKAASAGIKVYILADAYGSKNLPDKVISELMDSGIQFRKFSPAGRFTKLFLGKRLHHKVLVTDGRHCLVGGINIADRYSGFDGGETWLDYAIYIKGTAAKRVQRICVRLFFRHRFNPLKNWRGKFNRIRKIFKTKHTIVAFNDWYRQHFEISHTYRLALRNVKSEAIILASYFLPSVRIMRLLRKASKRGVTIKIILPANTDVPLFNYTSKFLYEWMLKNKIEIYEYQPGMLHAKCALMDNDFLTVGSFNFISLSEYGSVEMNINIFKGEIINTARKEFERVMETDCHLVTREHFARRPFISRLLDRLAFYFVRAGMRLYLFFSTDDES